MERSTSWRGTTENLATSICRANPADTFTAPAPSPYRHLSASRPTRQGVTPCTIPASTLMSGAMLPQRRDTGAEIARRMRVDAAIPRPAITLNLFENETMGRWSGVRVA
ncbi:hypothetical protein MesoLjLc_17600 [Mesorhizobium sp. L-8-10]|nr:hypothetical protein MesoLjLc_17600 [Mesorhizobium sp. L-8-10]